MTTYADRPWLGRYRTGDPSHITVEHRSMLDLFASTVARHGGRPAVRP